MNHYEKMLTYSIDEMAEALLNWRCTNCYDSSLDEDRVCIHIDDCFRGIKNSLLSEVKE